MPASRREIKIQNATLWIYKAFNGQLFEYSNVDIFQKINPYTKESYEEFSAQINAKLKRRVAGMEYAVWCYPKNNEYLVWTTDNNAQKIVKDILVKAITHKMNEETYKALQTIKRAKDILDTALLNLKDIDCVANEEKEIQDIHTKLYGNTSEVFCIDEIRGDS